MQDYLDGKDVYMLLAHAYKPNLSDDELRKDYRSRCKALILALHYGMSDQQLAHNLDFTMEQVLEFKNTYFTRYPDAKKFIEQSVDYCTKNGRINTIFGDKLIMKDPKKFKTSGINWVCQNGASVALADGFWNITNAMWQLGIPYEPWSVVHDSNQSQLFIKDIFHADMVYRKFFRQYMKDMLKIDFAYDLDLLKNFRDHTEYKFNMEAKTVDLTGTKSDIDYYLKYWDQSYDMKVLERTEEPPNPDPMKDDLMVRFSGRFQKREHIYCGNPLIKKTPKTHVKLLFDYDFENDRIMKEIRKMPLNVQDTGTIYN